MRFLQKYSCVDVLQFHGVGEFHHDGGLVGRRIPCANDVDANYVSGSEDDVDESCEGDVDGPRVDVRDVCGQISQCDDDYGSLS